MWKYSLLLLSLIWALQGEAMAMEIKVGASAPEFSLPNQQGKQVALQDFRGQWVVLYFYPKDDTPGCTAEACSFRDHQLQLGAKNAVVLGVSVDDASSHQAFEEKYKLPFTLLSDEDGKVAKAYGSLLNLWVVKVAKRHTFIIDPEGKVAKIYRDVDAEQHAQVILQDLQALSAPK